MESPRRGREANRHTSICDDEYLSPCMIIEETMNLTVLKDVPPWEWPSGADRMILEILTNEGADSSNRLLAADLAGDFSVVNDELIQALLSILQNEEESEELRGTAAISLGPALESADTDGFDDPEDPPITEATFLRVQESLLRLYRDTAVPVSVRRKVLEASVRAPQEWHHEAVRKAYAGDEEEWKLTAVTAMYCIGGFDDQILEALESDNRSIQYQAICAAGSWGVEEAWPHVSEIISAPATEKQFLLAAIDAVASINPEEAGVLLTDLADSRDEEIAEAAFEAIAMAEILYNAEFDDGDDEW